MAQPTLQYWKKHRGLVWSNSTADDAVHIRAALLRPQYRQLLDIALQFGLTRVRREWMVLHAEDTPATRRAAVSVQRILANIEKGFALASA